MRLTRPGASARTVGARPNSASNDGQARSATIHLHGLELRGLVVGVGIGGEHAGANFAACEILQPVAHAVGRVELRMKVRLGARLAVGGGLVDRHYVGKWPLPESVVLQQYGFQRACKIAPSLAIERGQRRGSPLRSDPH